MDWLKVVMLPQYQALIKACRVNYEDKLPFLVLADWIEEQGHGSYAAFIRECCVTANVDSRSHREEYAEKNVTKKADYLFHVRQYIVRLIPELEGNFQVDRGFMRHVTLVGDNSYRATEFMMQTSRLYPAAGKYLSLWQVIRMTQPDTQIVFSGMLRPDITSNLDDIYKIRNV